MCKEYFNYSYKNSIESRTIFLLLYDSLSLTLTLSLYLSFSLFLTLSLSLSLSLYTHILPSVLTAIPLTSFHRLQKKGKRPRGILSVINVTCPFPTKKSSKYQQASAALLLIWAYDT